MKRYLSVAMLLLATTASQAAITVVLDAGPIADGPNYRYEYTAQQAAGDEMRATDFFTIYDVFGYVSAAGPAGFAIETADVGLTPPTQSPTDDPDLINVSFVRTGGAIAGDISGFSIISRSGQLSVNSFTGLNRKDPNQALPGSSLGSIGSVPGPGTDGSDTGIPEPATMGLMGSALVGLGVLARRRK